jgi:hypothetical protein
MANVTILYRNILENSTVTSTDANASFPLYRTYDRDVQKLFKFSTHGANLYVQADQGAVTSYEVDRLIIPVGHTLNGLNCKLQSSATGAWAGEETDRLSWAQADALIINKTFAAATVRYWRLLITSDPAAPPELPEIYLTNDYVMEDNVGMNSSDAVMQNFVREETRSGKMRRVKLGESKQSFLYNLSAIGAAQKTNFKTWLAACDGIKPVYMLDHDGTLRYMELMNKDLKFDHLGADLWKVDLDLLEVI